MLPGETINSGASDVCPDCKQKLIVKVCQSGGGYYLGTWCCCGPYSRESEYFATEELANVALVAYNKGCTFMLRR
jgi:hypothetical protein